MLDVQPIIKTAQQAAEPKTIEIAGRTYAKKGELELITPPRPSVLAAATLQGVVDYVKSLPDGESELFVHVQSPFLVSVNSAPDQYANQRVCWLIAKAEERWCKNRQAGQYLSQEDLIIWLMQGFAPAADHERLLAVVSTLKAENIVEATDNGLSQAVAVKTGIQSGYAEIKNPYRLQPYRTFAEIAPPLMTFVVRARNGKEKEPPQLALFDADAGLWEVTAVAAVKAWLAERLPETTIIG